MSTSSGEDSDDDNGDIREVLTALWALKDSDDSDVRCTHIQTIHRLIEENGPYGEFQAMRMLLGQQGGWVEAAVPPRHAGPKG